jgi:CheY-like chemotaxis protein
LFTFKRHLLEPNDPRFLFEPSSIHGNILVAEDHPVNQMLLVALLRKLAHKVTAVNNGEEALREFINANCTDGATQYDLILMDCQMPEMDGYQATRAIREEERIFFARSKLPDNDIEKDYTHRIPIIAITANAIETNQNMCYEAGMDDFVTKPITLRQVSAMVTKWLLVKTKKHFFTT